MIFTSFYVPLEDRQKGRSSMIANAANPNHLLLGGVFHRAFPLLNKENGFEEIWGWTKSEERQTLLKIYEFFQNSWKLLEGKSANNPDLIVIGTGISRI